VYDLIAHVHTEDELVQSLIYNVIPIILQVSP